MRKDDLIEHVASVTDSSKAEAKRAVEATFDAIATSLVKGDEVVIPQFGNFVVRDRAARQGRNPQTGETINIAASKAVGFKPSSVLKREVNS